MSVRARDACVSPVSRVALVNGENPNVEKLLLNARAGDAVAQDRLRETLRPRMESLAGYYASRTGMDAGDLLQEAWLAVFEVLPTVDVTVGTPSQFLLKHARWQILDHIRWNKRRTHDKLDDLMTETAEMSENSFGASPNWSGSTADVEARMLVEDLEQRLNQRQRAILHGLLDGHTWRQIGDSLGCTSANVAYHVRGIRQAFTDLVDTRRQLDS